MGIAEGVVATREWVTPGARSFHLQSVALQNPACPERPN